MKLPIYQVDAFTSELFRGNPAAVVILEEKLPDEVLLAIAQENNLSETAFVRPRGDDFELRWFTPRVEVDLCGHATLACAFILFSEQLATGPELRFATASGQLLVRREADDGLLSMDFPARPPEPVEISPSLVDALTVRPEAVFKARDLMAVLASEQQVAELTPRIELLAKLDEFSVMVTAAGAEVDFVSRFFAPRVGVDEDPVTGSAHCTLVPYWAERLNKSVLRARQLSARGGELFCTLRGDRVVISGFAVEYLRGHIAMG